MLNILSCLKVDPTIANRFFLTSVVDGATCQDCKSRKECEYTTYISGLGYSYYEMKEEN